MTENRYSAHGIEAEFEPGSRKRVLRNRLGVVRVREMQQVESEAQIAVRKWAVSHFGPSHRSSSAGFRELHGRLTVSASIFLKGLKIPSMADELAALRRMAASRRFGSRNHTLHSNKESFITPSVCQSPNVVLHSVVNKHGLTPLDTPASAAGERASLHLSAADSMPALMQYVIMIDANIRSFRHANHRHNR